jgi:cobalt-zinc-cadmium efflux system membrane fusion protein
MDMKPSIFLILVSTLSLTGWSLNTLAGGNHGHHGPEESHEESEKKGPKGGKLLENGHFALEITIYENGVPPEMRVYAYEDGEAIDPSTIDLNVTLNRIDARDQLTFKQEQDYLVSDLTIYEPHSYEVEVTALYESEAFEWHYDNFEGRTQISPRMLELSGIETETAKPKSLRETQTLFGVIEVPTNQKYTVISPYISIVEEVYVQLGDLVSKGQPLLKVKNVNSLQSYIITSPGKGEITFHDASIGNRTAHEPIIKITDLSKVWVNLSAFPENVEKMKKGQPVSVYDLHHHEKQQGKIIYVAPSMTGGHIARARALIDNKEGHWRPGMHVKADITTNIHQAQLAVKKSALQTFRDFTVVFAKFGNEFEMRPLELGKSDGEYIEVLAGLKTDTEYATDNSFVIKADILKSGASHDH